MANSAYPLLNPTGINNGTLPQSWGILLVDNGDTPTTYSFAVSPSGSGYATPANEWAYAAAASGISNTTTAVTVKTAGAAGIRNYVTAIDLSWSALTTGTEIALRDGASGTVIWRQNLIAGAAGDRAITFPNPLRGTAATLLEFVTITATGASGAVYVNVHGYQAA